MPQIFFNKLSEHTAEIKDENVVLWRVSTLSSDSIQAGKIFYVRASKVHLTLDKIYWTDSRYLIHPDKVRLPKTINIDERKQPMSYPGDPSLFQQIECGTCKRVSLVSIDPAVQGAHQCVNCKGTICIIAGKQMQLKNGALALNTVKGQRK